MADMSNIASFNNSDGLSPWLIQKLNNNFWAVVQKITDPEVVMVAGSSFPEPRTNETLFYKTDTYDLYIWGEYIPAGQSDPVEGWVRTDLGCIRVEDRAPASDEQTLGEIIWYSQDEKQFYILTSSVNFSLPLRWYSLESYIYAIASAAVI